MRTTTLLFKALSDPNRLRILMMLREKPLCVCELTTILRLANSTVSKHLSILRNSNLIMDEKSGRWVNYRLATPAESKYIKEILPLLETWLEEAELVNSDALAVKTVDRSQICCT